MVRDKKQTNRIIIMKIACCHNFVYLVLILTIGCAPKTEDKDAEVPITKSSPCSESMFQQKSLSVNKDFLFLNGSWQCSNIIKCRRSSLYNDSLLAIAKNSYLCAQLPYIKFYTVNSFGSETYQFSEVDTVKWEKSILRGDDRLVRGSFTCDFRMDRPEAKRFSVNFPNSSYWFEYISPDTITYMYDNFLFVFTKVQ